MPVEDAESRDAEIGRIINDYLDRRRRGDEIREDDLLRAHPDLADELQAHFAMVRQVISVSAPDSPLADTAPVLPVDALPGYQILDEIHRGGQGVVYRALQKATRREVAIKVTREGPFAGWRDRARFEREVHVLGALRHPSIVTIHDSGTAAGSQYFVMDYIAGAPLDLWLAAPEASADRSARGRAAGSRSSPHRPLRELLELFVQICDAINAAHIKGIIHRDLKPGNIRIDPEGRPHILDFGLAKVTSEPDPERAGMTAVGQFVGSLPWTSPEQAQGTLDQVDTRTDVYALGVILFQMLTGAFPYDVVGPVRDVLNRIVTQEPTRPGALRPDLDRDVDAIVLKCLRKEPHRRYQTAGELGADVQRYLAGQPVAARSDSSMYVLGKLLRRYRLPVAVAAAFALLITASLLASLSLWHRAVRERDRAIIAEREQLHERRRADAQAAEALQARQVAEQQAERLRRIDYLSRISLARNAHEQHFIAQARQELAACPPDLREWEWHWLARLCRPPVILEVRADDRTIESMVLSRDGRRLITGGYDGRIRIWDAHNGEELSRLEGHTAQVAALALSPDSRWLASSSPDRTLRLWDLQTGSQQVLEEGGEYVHCLAFSPDGTLLVAGGSDRVLTFREIPSGKVVRITPQHDGEVLAVAFSPDGRHVASGESLQAGRVGASSVRLFEVATGEVRTLVRHEASILCVAFSPDGRHIASGSSTPAAAPGAQGTLKVCEVDTGRELLSLRGHEGIVDDVAFSPDGTRLASTGAPRIAALGAESDHTLKIWQLDTGEPQVIYSAHEGGGRGVAWSPDGQHLYSAGSDGVWKVWPDAPPPHARTLLTKAESVSRIAFSPDGRRLAAIGPLEDDQPAAAAAMLAVYDLETGEATEFAPLPPERPGASARMAVDPRTASTALAWSPDGQRIVAADPTGTVRIWNSQTARIEATIPGTQVVHDLAVGDGRAGTDLLAVALRTDIHLHRISERRVLQQLRQGGIVATVTFSPDGTRLASAAVDGIIRIWNPITGGQELSFATGSGLHIALWSPDGTRLATGHSNGVIALWDAHTGQPAGRMAGTQRPVQAMAFSPDGQRIAVCMSDARVALWDLRTEREVYAIHAHDAPVTSVAFSPDGRILATGGDDGLIKLWDAGPEAALASPDSRPAGTNGLNAAMDSDPLTVGHAGTQRHKY